MRSESELAVVATCNGETRPFGFVGASFQELYQTVSTLFGCTHGAVIKYVDDDGDLITISSDVELEHATLGANPLALHVVRVVPPTTAPSQVAFASATQPNYQVQPSYVASAQLYPVVAPQSSFPSQLNYQPPPLAHPGPFVGAYSYGAWADYKRKCKDYLKSLSPPEKIVFKHQLKKQKAEFKAAKKQEKKSSKCDKGEKKEAKKARKMEKKAQKALQKARKAHLVQDGASLVSTVDVSPAMVNLAIVSDDAQISLANSPRMRARLEKRAAKDALKAKKRSEKDQKKMHKRMLKDEQTAEKWAKKDASRAEKRAKKDLAKHEKRAKKDRKEEIERRRRVE